MPVYFGNLRITEINRLEQIKYRAAKLVTGALKYTSKIKLFNELGWESLQTRYDCLGLSLFHKIHLGNTQPLIKTFMPDIQPKIHNNCVSLYYKPFTLHNKQFALSFYPYFTKKLNNSHKT